MGGQSQFQRIYPGSGGILLDGGLNNKFEKSIIGENESPDCLNVIFENGSVGTRPGWSKVNTTAIGSFVFDGLYVRRGNDNAETMVAWANGTAWTLGGTTFSTIASAQSVFTAGVRVGAAQDENHIFFGNGFVTPYKYNGAHFTRHGVPAATGAVSTASSTTITGALTGDYRYRVTYVNSQAVEGDVGTSTVTISVISAKIDLSSIPVAPISHGVNKRKIYRTVTSGATFSLLTTINDNTTTTYQDNTADSGLGTAAPTDNGEPPKYSSIVYHVNRLFMNDVTNPNYIWYTEVAQPYTVKSTSFIRIGDNTSDLVKAVNVYNGIVVVLCENSMWYLYMTDPADATTWKPVRTKSPYGSMSPYACFFYNNKMGFVAVQNNKLAGIAALAGDTVQTSATLLTVASAGSDLISNPIETDVFSFVEAQAPNFSSIVFKNRAYVSVTYGAGNTTNNRVYVYDFSISDLSRKQEGAWVPFTGLNAAQFAQYAGDLYYGSSTATGFLYKQTSSTYSDDGTAINSYFWTKEMAGHKTDINEFKDLRYLNILVDQAGAYFMNMTYKVDSDLGGGNVTTIDLTPGGSLWGTMMWGRDSWGGGKAQDDKKLFLGQARGQRIQFKFDNQNKVNQRFKVHRIDGFGYNNKGVR